MCIKRIKSETQGRVEKFCYPSHIAFYTYHLNCLWMAVIFFLFIFFCHSIFVQFSFPFLSTDKHSSVARTAKCICICNGIVTAQHKWKWRLSRVPRRVGVGVERASLKSRESRTMQCPWHWWRIGRQLDGQIFIIASCGVFIKSNLLTSSEEIR